MREIMKASVLPSTIIVLSSVHQMTAQRTRQDGNSQGDSKISTIEWCLPMIAVTVVLLIITVAIVFTVYRQKKYGAFCCFMPKMRYRVSPVEEGDCEDSPTPPPSYATSQRHIIAPPDYRDALQDILLDSGDVSIRTTGPSESRYTSWSNSLINDTPPAYSAAATTASKDSEPVPGSTSGDATESTMNVLSYTTTPTLSLPVNSSAGQITGAVPLPQPHTDTSRESSSGGDCAPLTPE